MSLTSIESGGTQQDGRKLKSEKSEKSKKGKKDKKSKSSKSSKKSSSESEEEPEPPPPPDSGMTEIYIVTHSLEEDEGNNVNSFWSTWREGADLAVAGRPDTEMVWKAVGYDADAAAYELSVACSLGDAVVVTVPYASTTDEYQKMDDAINQCIANGKPVFTANTDTYHNEDVYAFFGTSNYDMGIKCALSVLFPEDPDVAQGRKDAPRLSENRNDVQIYWDAASKQDEGLKQRLEGLQTTFAKHSKKVTVFEPSGRSDCPCVTEYPEGVHVNDGEGLKIRIPSTEGVDPNQVFDYPEGYGFGVCGEHDRNLAPSCNSAKPESFCFSKWCYVDPLNCAADYTYDAAYIWDGYEGSEYPYSYATCGENNVYLDFLDGTEPDGVGAVGISGDGVQTIVLSSDWAPKFDPSNPNSDIFICGEESTELIGIPQVGQSPFMQGLSATAAALAAAIALEDGTPWNAFKGNAASTSTSQVFHSAQQITDSILTDPLSRYGKAIVEKLDEYYVSRGITWDIWHDAVFEDDWILQHPPQSYIGQSSVNLNVPECCIDTEGANNAAQLTAPCNAENRTADDSANVCNFDFGLYKCDTDADCGAKDFFINPDNLGPYLEPDDMANCLANGCPTDEYFAPGMCEEVSATRTSASGSTEKLCVGHSHNLYERMYNLIIQADHLVEITSLDSFDLIGSWGNKDNGNPFLSAIRNALTYLSKTGKQIIVKCHFGSIAGGGLQDANENTQRILEQITRDITDSQMTVWVGTYRYSFSSWNHGKIISIDGKKLITGGSNYYQTHYLREDPVHDVSLQVSGGPSITAHRYAQRLWRTACDWWTFPGFNQVHYFVSVSERQPDGTIDTNTISGLNSCPAAITSMVEDDILDDVPDDRNRPKTGKSVIAAARLANLGESIQGGSHTSDIAMLAMMDEAQESIKLSQQDVLPLLLGIEAGTAAGVITSGYTFTGRITAASFDDTWRIIGGIAKAISRGIDVYMMLSAPCAFSGDSIHYMQQPVALGISAQYKCPLDGTQGDGWDYWEQAYIAQLNQGYSKWPDARDGDKEWAHIEDGSPFPHHRDLKNGDADQQETNPVHRDLAYGYGWTLENVADWIFAYFMIVKDSRPEIDGRSMTAEEIAEHICRHAHIGHIRVTAEEDTYNHKDRNGGQIGNHAKIVMIDDQIFYIGSDNAYGSGLAEFGMITDDADIAGEFNEKYWEPLWEATLGTASNPGLVSGSSSLAGTCKWYDGLEGRGYAPWNDITHSWCRTFSNGQDCREAEGCTWVDKVIPHVQCVAAPHDQSCYLETDYCTGNLLPNDAACWEDTVCESLYCTWDFVCADKLGQGESCFEHDDCELGYCSWSFECDGAQLQNGDTCFFDDACQSGRCSSITWECEDKLEGMRIFSTS